MRPQSQGPLLILVFVFVIALSIAVATVCVSYLREDDFPSRETAEETTSSTESGENPDPEESASAETTESEAPGGLRYASRGDGTCRLVSIGSCADACVVIPEFAPTGDRVTAIDARAFYGSSTVSAVQIPASVRQIGELAFADCPNLLYISVSPQNAAFCDIDGVLYTSDERTLIQYPPKRAGEEVLIRGVTVEICDMAFYNCASLCRVTFTGSAEQWETIRIGIKNYSLTAAAKRFEG